MAKPEQIQAIAQRVAEFAEQGHSVLVVVSAMGKTTDQLMELAYQVSPTPNRRELDMLLSTGERISMALMSMAINDRGASAISFTGSQAGVLTDDSHSAARIIDIKPMRVEAELGKKNIVVLAGFQGVSPRTKEITTLGRGGSDTTAVAMAAHFKAPRCEILKDVDGVYSADPNLIKGAEHLPRLHFLQLLDMTYWGAKVLHYRSVELAHLLNIPLMVGLAHGEGSNTIIDGESKMYEQAAILSINTHKDVRWLKIKKADLNACLQSLQLALTEANLPWPQLLDTERDQDACSLLITNPTETLNAIGKLHEKNPDIEYRTENLSVVAVTCQGSYASNFPEKICSALSKRSVIVQKLILGAMSIAVVVESKDRDKATQALHDLRGELAQINLLDRG